MEGITSWGYLLLKPKVGIYREIRNRKKKTLCVVKRGRNLRFSLKVNGADVKKGEECMQAIQLSFSVSNSGQSFDVYGNSAYNEDAERIFSCCCRISL